MIDVIKLIIRLDYQPNYKVIDGKGMCLTILSSAGEGFWKELGETDQGSRVIARSTAKDSEHKHITIDPASFVMVAEHYPGVSLEKAQEGAIVHKCSELFDKFRSEFQIDRIKRAGFRVTCFAKGGAAPGEIMEKFKPLIHKAPLKVVEDTLGQARDFAYVFEGKSKDDVSYRVIFGPHKATDEMRYYETLKIELPKNYSTPYSISADLDFFEEDFSIRGIQIAKWARPKWFLASEICEKALGLLQES